MSEIEATNYLAKVLTRVADTYRITNDEVIRERQLHLLAFRPRRRDTWQPRVRDLGGTPLLLALRRAGVQE